MAWDLIKGDMSVSVALEMKKKGNIVRCAIIVGPVFYRSFSFGAMSRWTTPCVFGAAYLPRRGIGRGGQFGCVFAEIACVACSHRLNEVWFLSFSVLS